MMRVNTGIYGNSEPQPPAGLGSSVDVLCLLLRPSPRGLRPRHDKAASPGLIGRVATSSEIRLGMSADFTARARALGIELYRGAMAYLLPVNAAGGVNGRRIVIKDL